jgi:uncharacterized membrane protein
MAGHPSWARAWLTDEDFEAISAAIVAAERQTAAEIRVHLERHVKHRRWSRRVDPLARARWLFTHLGMHRTAGRHGVLIYLALEDRKLAIVGDEGIHARVGDEYWHRIRDLMIERVRAGRVREAVVASVAEVGRVLIEHFPRRPDDTNELSDHVSTG